MNNVQQPFTPKFECPRCSHYESKVIDTGPATDTNGIYRRRQCGRCGWRYNTRETLLIDKKNPHTPISGGSTLA